LERGLAGPERCPAVKGGSKVKIAVLYHSESGNTKKIAELIAEGAAAAGDVEARAMNIDTADEEFVEAAKAVVLGSPTYYGMYSWQVKKWLDTTKIKLADKLGSVFATANGFGGGAEMAEMGLAGILLTKGMLVYTAGVAKGAPFTHLGAVAVKGGDAAQQERAKLYGRRIAEKAAELFAGR
jgi:NAD(P)H dehydrogenase (quinone)